ncbi:MAG: multiubiquitin domain-containing protein [Acidobacteria bacterium]|nr:multiubiquitin domain-containing protein [Acidobacteriota bacterium]
MTLAQPTDTVPHGSGGQPGAAHFVFDVDGTTYTHNRPTITGLEIMDAAGIRPSDGLVQIFEDGTTRSVAPDDEVRLVPDARFKRRPRFKRG